VSKKNFLKSSAVVLFITFAVKLIAFVKQAVIGYYLGATAHTDVYYIVYELVASVVFIAFSAVTIALIPLYQNAKSQSVERANALVSGAMVSFGAIAIILSIVVFAFAPELSFLLAGGNEAISSAEMVLAIRLLSSVVFLGFLQTLFGAVLEANFIFSYSKFFGLILSSSIIACVVFLSDYIGAESLIVGTLIAYVVQVLILVGASLHDTDCRLCKPAKMKEISPLLLSVVPIMIGNGVYQTGNLIDKVIAANVGVGLPSALSYAQTITDSVCALTITSVVSVFFSYASQYVAKGNHGALSSLVSSSRRVLLSVSVPFAILVFFSSGQIVDIVYARGAFDIHAQEMTSLALKGLAVGMPFLVFREVYARVHYAFGNTKIPMINGAVAVVVHIPLSFILSRYIGILGIALGAAATFCVCGLAIMFSARRYVEVSEKGDLTFYIRLLLASFLSGCIVTLVAYLLDTSSLVTFLLDSLIVFAVFGVLLFGIVKKDLKAQRELRTDG